MNGLYIQSQILLRYYHLMKEVEFMIEKGVTEGINKFYYLLKLSMYIWVISLVGCLIFGLIPAIISGLELFQTDPWNEKTITLRSLYDGFKRNFIQANQIGLTFSLVCFILLYSLWFSIQIEGIPFLLIDFLLVFMIILVSISFFHSLSILAMFEISYKNLCYLSCILFFKETRVMLTFSFCIFLFLILAYKLPALLFFCGGGTFVVILAKVGTKTGQKLQFI